MIFNQVFFNSHQTTIIRPGTECGSFYRAHHPISVILAKDDFLASFFCFCSCLPTCRPFAVVFVLQRLCVAIAWKKCWSLQLFFFSCWRKAKRRCGVSFHFHELTLGRVSPPTRGIYRRFRITVRLGCEDWWNCYWLAWRHRKKSWLLGIFMTAHWQSSERDKLELEVCKVEGFRRLEYVFLVNEFLNLI